MTLEFVKTTRSGEEVCVLSTKKIKALETPLWLTKENFREIKSLMNW